MISKSENFREGVLLDINILEGESLIIDHLVEQDLQVLAKDYCMNYGGNYGEVLEGMRRTDYVKLKIGREIEIRQKRQELVNLLEDLT